MSRLVGKPTMWFTNRSDTNRPVKAQKRARILKFRMYVEEELYYQSSRELYYQSSKNKGADQLAVTAKLICVFVFAYVDCWFSHEAAQILQWTITFLCLRL